MNVPSSLALLALALTVSCGGGGSSYSTPPPPAGPPANTVWVGSSDPYGGGTMSFSPATLTVSVGTTVTFSWQGGTHTVTSYAYNSSPTFPGVPMPGQSSGTYAYQFNTAGTYYYYCEYHGTLTAGGTSLATGMAGKVIVQ